MTLIEKLEARLREFEVDYVKMTTPASKANVAGNMNGLRTALNIIKQHSDWVSFNNKPPKNLQRILVCFKEKGIISGTWFADSKNPNDGFFSSDNGLSDFYRLSDNTMDLWQPIQPPSEVQE